jgi:hypothetical protein
MASGHLHVGERVVTCALVGILGLTASASPAQAEEVSDAKLCSNSDMDAQLTHVQCRVSQSAWSEMQARQLWSYALAEQVCTKQATGEWCYSPRACASDDGTPGTWFWIKRAPYGTSDWQDTRWLYCKTATEAKATITPAMAAAEMKRLEWPTPDLVIQPPGGRTLVNFPTNAYSRLSTDAKSQTVTVLGREVEIGATPEEFTWSWAQPGESAYAEDLTPLRTTSPGAPYEEGVELEVSHEYRDAGVTVTASVSVTYRGRFRVDGGEWQDIPDTLTVAGDSQSIEVLEAHARLVS